MITLESGQPIKPNNEFQTITKRNINRDSIDSFKNLLNEANWELLKDCKEANSAFELFNKFFLNAYEKSFPKIEKRIKKKVIENPWMTKGLLKSSKKKQRLYEKFLKSKTIKNEQKYKTYKNLFEKLKKSAKKNYYSEQLIKFHGNAKRTWDILKEVTGKSKNSNDFPNYISTGKDNETLVYEKEEILEHFNNFYINVGKNLAEKIEPSARTFESYLNYSDSEMPQSNLTMVELENAFKTLESNKSDGIDKINVNIIKSTFEILKPHLFFVFDLSLKQGLFPDILKQARVVPVFKMGEPNLVSNYINWKC